jgi:integrase/recombinase XerD
VGERTKTTKPKSLLLSPGEPGGMRARVNEHLEWLLVRNYSAYAVYGRAKELMRFVLWCEERGLRRPAEVTKPILERYQRWLFHYRKRNGHPLGASTQYGAIVVVRGYFRWLARENLVLSNPAADLVLPRLGKRLPQAILSPAEVELVLNQPDVKTPLGLRDRAILETLYSTGMRRRELVSLAVFDLDFERGTLFIRQGKGKKDRLIPISERALAWVARYLEEVRPKLVMEPDPGFVFLTVESEALHPDWLSATARSYVEASGVKKRGACHLFRHSMATAMLEGGADIRFIQAMLGHADLRATEIYTQVSIRKLKEIHAATHPGAKLERKEKPAADGKPAAQEAAAELLETLDAEADEEELDGAAELAGDVSTLKSPAARPSRGGT